YNADTPTSVFETAVFQWMWLEDAIARQIVPRDADQYNSLHERLIDGWKTIAQGRPLHLAGMTAAAEGPRTPALPQGTARPRGRPIDGWKPTAQGRHLHLAGMTDDAEDLGTLAYLEDTARQAGLTTTVLAMADIGRTPKGQFVDRDDRPIELAFKLYPWEGMF